MTTQAAAIQRIEKGVTALSVQVAELRTSFDAVASQVERHEVTLHGNARGGLAERTVSLEVDARRSRSAWRCAVSSLIASITAILVVILTVVLGRK